MSGNTHLLKRQRSILPKDDVIAQGYPPVIEGMDNLRSMIVIPSTDASLEKLFKELLPTQIFERLDSQSISSFLAVSFLLILAIVTT